MRMYEYENTGNRVSLEDMKLEVSTRPNLGWDDDMTTEFAVWLNDTFTPWDVFDAPYAAMFVEQWVQHLAETDPEMLYECTGYREVEG